MRIEGGSVGFQIGGVEIDVVMVVMNDKGIDRLLSNKFTVGADAAVAAGPVGRQASAQTDATMRAEMLAWSHSRGVFAGIALQGATLREDNDENKALYGRAMTNREIVKGRHRRAGRARGSWRRWESTRRGTGWGSTGLGIWVTRTVADDVRLRRVRTLRAPTEPPRNLHPHLISTNSMSNTSVPFGRLESVLLS